MRDALELLKSETLPPDEAIRRVKDGVLGDEQLSRSALQALPAPPEDAALRVRAQVLAAAREGVRPARDWRPLLAGGGLALAGAAALLIAVQPAPTESTPEAVALAVTDLKTAAAMESLSPTEHVDLAFSGKGTLSGTDLAPRVAWESGTLRAEVTHGMGIDLRVNTDEAEVRVVGTVFEVTRDAKGTTVSVERGEVAVSCAEDGELRLTTGQTGECLPTTAARLLGRAKAMQEAGRYDDMLLAADRGLSRADAGSAWADELAVKRITALAALERRGEAIDQASSWLSANPESDRVVEVHRITAALALQGGDCATAWPHLDALPDRTDAEQAWYQSCPPAE